MHKSKKKKSQTTGGSNDHICTEGTMYEVDEVVLSCNADNECPGEGSICDSMFSSLCCYGNILHHAENEPCYLYGSLQYATETQCHLTSHDSRPIDTLWSFCNY